MIMNLWLLAWLCLMADRLGSDVGEGGHADVERLVAAGA
jgi:hypothetical protein